MKRLLLVGLFLIPLSGCSVTDAADQVDLDEYENAIIVELAGGKKVPPVTPVNRKHKREDCPTGGWVGDGVVKTRCLDCDPPWPDSQAEKKPEVKKEVKKEVPFGQNATTSTGLTSSQVAVAPAPVYSADDEVDDGVVYTSTQMADRPIAAPARAAGRLVGKVVRARPLKRIWENKPVRRFLGGVFRRR